MDAGDKPEGDGPELFDNEEEKVAAKDKIDDHEQVEGDQEKKQLARIVLRQQDKQEESSSESTDSSDEMDSEDEEEMRKEAERILADIERLEN